jgi:ABC-type nitrate/sulfonate/bicarbonate transport system substrate-binding protein
MNTTNQAQLRICTFKGLQNLPMFVARQQGFFAQQGLEAAIEYTAGSIPQIAGLARGASDLIQTAPDNVVNVESNPAAFGLDPASAPRIRLLFGGSTGPLCLYAQPTVTTFDDLRGAALGVDNPGSGFALVLRDLLARNGLHLERDYRFVVAGGTSTRLDALQQGTVAATILYAPFDLMAAEGGFRRLASSTDVYTAYASLATAGTQEWVEAQSDLVTGYLVALRQALHWLYDPAHAKAAQHLIAQEPSLGVPASLAARVYASFVDPAHGFGEAGMLDEAGLQQVIDLRAIYGASSAAPGAPRDYLDLRCSHQASERIKQMP